MRARARQQPARKARATIVDLRQAGQIALRVETAKATYYDRQYTAARRTMVQAKQDTDWAKQVGKQTSSLAGVPGVQESTTKEGVIGAAHEGVLLMAKEQQLALEKSCALALQQAWRGRLAWKRVRGLQAQLELELRSEGAVQIQCFWRRHAASAWVSSVREERERR
jgi:hypothetical protein